MPQETDSPAALFAVELDYSRSVSFAMEQNDVPFVRRIACANIGHQGAAPLRLRLTTEPAVTEEQLLNLGDCPKGHRVDIPATRANPRLLPHALANLNERQRGALIVEVLAEGPVSEYTARGWHVVPLQPPVLGDPETGKRPLLRDWTSLRLSVAVSQSVLGERRVPESGNPDGRGIGSRGAGLRRSGPRTSVAGHTPRRGPDLHGGQGQRPGGAVPRLLPDTGWYCRAAVAEGGRVGSAERWAASLFRAFPPPHRRDLQSAIACPGSDLEPRMAADWG